MTNISSCNCRWSAWRSVVTAVAAALGLASLPAEAQQGPPPQPPRIQEAPAPMPEGPPPLGPGGNFSPAEIQRLFDAYALVQAQETLRLDDQRYGQFVSRLKVLQETRRRLQQERQRRLQELLRLSNQPDPVDENLLRDRVRALADHDERASAEVRKAYDGVDQVLDVRQQARFRVFEEQMERRKLELLMRARQANRPAQRRQPLP
jgi:hypothetical protein